MKKTTLALFLAFAFAALLPAAPAGLTNINFTTSQAQFAAGDSITIQEVLATSANLTVGETFVVRGTYTLQSQAAATMSISLTTTEPVGVPNQPTARRSITAGTGTFEMEYTVQFAGTIYIAFTPVAGGSSFGRIYFAGSPGPGGGTTNPPPSNPTTPPTVTPPISTTGLSNVPFATSRASFETGDAITITEVFASSPRIEAGDTVVVRGTYTLQSRVAAMLAISLTTNAPGVSTPIAAQSRKAVESGTGTFELAYEIKQPGSLHVTFYPATSGSSFGGVYFAAPGSTGSTTVAVNNPNANTGRLGNLSIRSLVGPGEGTLVAGMTVTDQERYVVIRGVGPSLGAFGLTGFLRKPVLSVYSAAGELIATTGSWSAAYTGNQRTGIQLLMSSVGAFPLTAGSDDAVLNLRLTPGGYTVNVATGDGQSGVALLEIYSSATFSLPAGP